MLWQKRKGTRLQSLCMLQLLAQANLLHQVQEQEMVLLKGFGNSSFIPSRVHKDLVRL